MHENIKEMCNLFLPAASPVESESLLAELEIFCNVILSHTDLKLESLQDVATRRVSCVREKFINRPR